MSQSKDTPELGYHYTKDENCSSPTQISKHPVMIKAVSSKKSLSPNRQGSEQKAHESSQQQLHEIAEAVQFNANESDFRIDSSTANYL